MDHIIHYIDRLTGNTEEEEVFGGGLLRFIYGSTPLGRFFSPFWQTLLCRNSLVSKMAGYYQRLPCTKKNIRPFVERFGIDSSEFQKNIEDFSSFNDFFVRKLKPEARPIDADSSKAVLPADGRYLFFPRIDQADGFLVKGKKFSLEDFLQDRELAEKYAQGTLVLVRLCPIDYHRFHFPCDLVPGEPQLIKGNLHSVNPLALRRKIEIFCENKRVITPLFTENFGTVLWAEIGATCVGSIHQTFTPEKRYSKGEEKGFFSFGGSSLVLLFEPGAITLDEDLLAASAQGLEIRGLFGQSMGCCN